MNLRRFRPLLPLVALLSLNASAAHASPVWIRVRIEDSAQGRIVDLPADGRLESSYVAGQFEVLGPGVSLPRVEPGPGSGSSPYQPGLPFTSAVNVTFRLPSPEEVADPINWSWRRDNHPADVFLSGTASGIAGWGGSPLGTYVSLDGTLDEGRTDGPDVHSTATLPPELLDLAAHPERVRITASATGRRLDQLVEVGVHILPATPTPEPNGLAVFGLLLGGGWLAHRRARRSR